MPGRPCSVRWHGMQRAMHTRLNVQYSATTPGPQQQSQQPGSSGLPHSYHEQLRLHAYLQGLLWHEHTWYMATTTVARRTVYHMIIAYATARSMSHKDNRMLKGQFKDCHCQSVTASPRCGESPHLSRLPGYPAGCLATLQARQATIACCITTATTARSPVKAFTTLKCCHQATQALSLNFATGSPTSVVDHSFTHPARQMASAAST